MTNAILVVDDNATNLKLACDILAHEGYFLLRAESAEAALEVLECSKPDLILMDIAMPGMDGLTLTRKLKADPKTRDILIVALTASAMRGDEQRVRAAGCDGYITKPIDTRSFPGQVAGYLQPKASESQSILVVDDHVTNRKLLRAILEADQLEVLEAEDGIEALEILGKRHIDAVISDVLMPRMDGYRLCHEVRHSERLQSIPFIIYTSTYSSAGDQKLALDMGADQYLTKPAPARAILDAVRMGPRRSPATKVKAVGQQDLVLMKEYNQQLVEKLEARNQELMQLSSELQTASDKLRHLLTHSPAVIYGLKVEEGRVTPHVVSDNITELLGFEVQECLRYEWWVGQLHPEDRQRAIDSLSVTLTQSTSRTEYRLRHKDGSYRWIDDNRRLIRDASNASSEMVGVWGDITDRKNAEEALSRSEITFHQFAENIPEIFWMANTDLTELIYVSPAYENILGRSIDHLYANPRDWTEAILPEDRDWVAECFGKLTHGASETSVEYRIRRPDGSIRWMLDRGFPIRDSSARLYRIAGIAKDVTERKILEENLRRAQKMEAIGQLAGGIAHDFNNILGCIVGYAEMAAVETAGNESVQSSLQEVLKASQRAKELILQILTFSRPQEQGRAPIRLQPVIQEALKLLRASLPSTIRIRSDIAKDAPLVMADETQIQQVVMNLVTNAAHAMDRTGELTVTLGSEEMDSEFVQTRPELRPGRAAVLSVGDTGCGMDRETQERIFEPFFTTKAPGEGTGLGLAVVHGIVKSHQGAITVYSEPGQGTTFRAYFPALEGTEKETAAFPATIHRGKGERVLLVDDEPSLVALGRKMLERAGYQVTGQTSAVEALDAFRAEPDHFDLLVTDLTMPSMNGTDLAREILKLRPGLPILLTTGFGGTMTSSKAQALGISEVLMKPATAQSLSESVHRVLASASGD